MEDTAKVFVPSFADAFLGEGKTGEKRKTEKEYIKDKYASFAKKMDKKREEIKEIEGGDDPAKVKSIRVRIKRVEIQIIEHELAIARLRDQNLDNRKELRDAK